VGIGGIIDLSRGRVEKAVKIFNFVRDQATALGADFFVVHMMLYLAIAELEAERPGECWELLKEVLSICYARNWKRQEVLAAKQILHRAFNRQALTKVTLENAIKEIRVALPGGTPSWSS
jgi:hypothetical protein